MVEIFDLGGVLTSIEGNNKYSRALMNYFGGAKLSNCSLKAQINIKICDSLEDMSFQENNCLYAERNGMKLSSSGFLMNHGRLSYRVDNICSTEKPTNIYLFYNERGWGKKIVKSFLSYFDPYRIGREKEIDRFLMDVLNYKALYWILAVAFLKFDKAFVHSGMVERNGVGIVLSGTGGCGKTSTVYEMLTDGWKYIAEDFGIIGADGTIWQIPKRGAISAEDVEYKTERLIEYVNGLPWHQKIRFRHFSKKGKNPLLSPSLEDLYGSQNISKRAYLSLLVCLVRSSTDEITIRQETIEEITERICSAAFRVIREMDNVFYNLNAIANEEFRRNLPNINYIQQKYKTTIIRALSRGDYYVMEVPKRISPKLIKDHLLAQ